MQTKDFYTDKCYNSPESRLSLHDNVTNIPGAQSGALLDMLAAVATQTLEYDSSTIRIKPRETVRDVNAVTQLLSLSAKRLIEMFSIFDGDEMRRMFTFTCVFDADHCKESFFSFGSESKARQLMKSHLLSHVQETEQQAARGLPVVVKKQSIKASRKRVAKGHCNVAKCSKPNQLKRKTIPSVKKKDSPVSSATNCSSLPSPPVSLSPLSALGSELTASPVSSEHNYTRGLGIDVCKEETIGLDNGHGSVVQESKCITTDNISRFMLGEVNGDPAVVAYFDCDELRLMQLPQVGQEIAITTTDAIGPFKQDNVPKIDDVRNLLPTDCDNKIMPSDSTRTVKESHMKKSRGKMKFIGQSKSEKDEALRLIEEAKRKGSSSSICLECNICCPSRHFTALTTLISHYRSHAGIKPFECMICGHAFTRQHSLNYHLLIHSNMTRFTCTDCGRKFRHPSHFKEHLRRHTGESPYECQDCSFRFKTRNTFKRHMKTRHGKVLTTSGSVVVLSQEEFSRVRTLPRPSNMEFRSATATDCNGHQLQEETAAANQEVDKENDKSDFSSNVNTNIPKVSFAVKSNNSSISALRRDIISDAMTQNDVAIVVEPCSNNVSNDDNNNPSALITVPLEESVVADVVVT